MAAPIRHRLLSTVGAIGRQLAGPDLVDASTLVIPPFLAYDLAMRHLAPITMLVLALAIAWPVVARGFKPDSKAGRAAHKQKDYATALRHWRPLAKQGHTRAQYWLGVMYDRGKGVPQHHKESVKWYHKAAEQGHVATQTFLGMMYSRRPQGSL